MKKKNPDREIKHKVKSLEKKKKILTEKLSDMQPKWLKNAWSYQIFSNTNKF